MMRTTAPGARLSTPRGTTYYEYRPGAKTKTAVLIHGFAVPSGVWEHNFRFLAERGYGVLRYDLFGRGRSRAGRAPHEMALFIAQLRDLLDEVRPSRPLALIGLSMGGAIAYQFCRAYPEEAEGLCLISPLVPGALPAVFKLALIPGLGNAILPLAAPVILRKNMPRRADANTLPAEWTAQAKKPGYRAALLSTFRRLVTKEKTYAYGPAPAALKSVRLIWGEADAVIPIRHANRLRRELGKCDFFPLPGVGHCSPWESPDEVNGILLDFMNDG